jgi:hypothetical protein
MAVQDDEILEYAETGFVLLPTVPGRSRELDIPRVRARQSDVDFPLVNLITAARFDENEAEERIAQLTAEYRAAGKPAMWMIGPKSTPTNLARLAEAHGFVASGLLDILVLRDIATPISAPDDVDVSEVRIQDLHTYDDLMARAYGLPTNVVELFNDSYIEGVSSVKARAYVASIEGVPVSIGYCLYIPGTSLVLLSGAATDETYRGRGSYSALVKRRLADARADGMETAYIQAVQTTSSPICRRMGFEPLGTIAIFIRPGDA